MKHVGLANDLLSPLDKAPEQAFISSSLQVADLLQWILNQTGKASVKIASFSISEEFLRRLFFIEKSGLIDSVEIILDFKATNKTLILWPFIEQTVKNCYLASSHAKVLLVGNSRWSVAVIMSQNLTRGNRFESGIISTSHHIFNTLSEQFSYITKNQAVPFHEVFCRTIGKN